jgi:hypothetical protein
MFDETTDSCGRYMLNILVGECSVLKRSIPYLMKTSELANTNSKNINIKIIDLMNEIYNNEASKFTNVKMLISDGAPYALKAGNLLKELNPDLKHVICLCHNLHNLCETIRKEAPNTNEIISFLKRHLVKNRHNQEKYINIMGKMVPKFPVISRWGTWIKFAVYLRNNFYEINKFINTFDSENYEIVNIKNIL